MTLHSDAILASEECTDAAVAAVGNLDAGGLARVGAAWWRQLEQVARVDPGAAGRLAAGMFAMLSAYRPESPAPLDAGFAPTEAVPTGEPGRAA